MLCFCCTTLKDVIFADKSFRKCYIIDLYATHAMVYVDQRRYCGGRKKPDWTRAFLAPLVSTLANVIFFVEKKSCSNLRP